MTNIVNYLIRHTRICCKHVTEKGRRTLIPHFTLREPTPSRKSSAPASTGRPPAATIFDHRLAYAMGLARIPLNFGVLALRRDIVTWTTHTLTTILFFTVNYSFTRVCSYCSTIILIQSAVLKLTIVENPPRPAASSVTSCLLRIWVSGLHFLFHSKIIM